MSAVGRVFEFDAKADRRKVRKEKARGKANYLLSKAIGSMVKAKKRRRKYTSGLSMKAKKGGRGGRFTWLGSRCECKGDPNESWRVLETTTNNLGTVWDAPNRPLRSASCPAYFQKTKYSVLYSVRNVSGKPGRCEGAKKDSWPSITIIGNQKPIHNRKYQAHEAASGKAVGGGHALLRLPSDNGCDHAVERESTTCENKTNASEYDLWLQMSDSLKRALQDGIIRPMAELHKSHSFSALYPKDTKCLRRLYREIRRDLPRGLEIDPFGSTFVRFDGDKPWLMRALITGTPDTPYADGVFLFDIGATDKYPGEPPQVVHVTPGANTLKLRHSPGGFSPNLHASGGKVCLSLLGTWDGIGWQANKSNIYQVLSAIGRDILGAEHPFYMEPGFGGWEGTAPTTNHEKKVLQCSEYIREATLRLAINAPLRQPPKGFEEEVANHFRAKKVAIERRIKHWITEAQRRYVEAKALVEKLHEQNGAGSSSAEPGTKNSKGSKGEEKEEKKNKKKKKKKNNVENKKMQFAIDDLEWVKGHCERISILAKETSRLLLKVATPTEVQAILKGAASNCSHVVATLERLRQLGRVMSVGNSIREPVVIKRGGIEIKGDTVLPWQGTHLEWEQRAKTKLDDTQKLSAKIKKISRKLQKRIESSSSAAAEDQTQSEEASLVVDNEDIASDDEEPYGVSAT